MTFFEEYLAANQQTPTPLRHGSREDEAALAFVLLQERLKRGSAQTGFYFSMPDSLDDLNSFAQANQFTFDEVATAIRFVTTFLCYFIPKLVGFRRDIENFRGYFIPGFWEESDKQVQLIGGLRDDFYTMTVDDLRNATSLSVFLDPATAPALADA
jgi:hypothetical protein